MVSAVLVAYALVLTIKLMPNSKDVQRHFDFLQIQYANIGTPTMSNVNTYPLEQLQKQLAGNCNYISMKTKTNIHL